MRVLRKLLWRGMRKVKIQFILRLVYLDIRVFYRVHWFDTNFLSLIQLFKYIVAVFNNMRTLKFKSQPTNAFFATVNQMFGGSSQLPITAERAVIKSNRRVQFRQHSRKLGGVAEHLIDGSEKRICRLSFESACY